jgi:hypothetical protein
MCLTACGEWANVRRVTRITRIAAVVSMACLAALWLLQRHHFEGYDRDLLPAFDAYAYVAMAEAPRYFTVAPWGYRPLTPFLVHVLPLDVVTGFKVLTFVGLAVSAVLLARFLARLGHGLPASLAAVVLFVFLGPTREVVQYPLLVEPVTLALEVAFLLCLAGRGSTGALALIAVLGALSKEMQVLLVPLVFFARRDPDGWRVALRKTLVVGLAAVAATLLVRTWVPLPLVSVGRPPTEAILAAWWRDWPETWRGLLMLGLTPLALVGACLPRARPFLKRFGYGLAVTLLVPFAAFVNVGDPRVIFFGKNTERLLLYAIPFLLPLALHALDALRGAAVAGAPATTTEASPLGRAAGGVALAILLATGLGLDRYRRLDLGATRDGPLVLTFCRESLAAARRLERGRFTTFDPGRDRYVAGESDARDLGRMRWYLRDGWGPRPSSISGAEVVMQQPRATLVLPCLRPDDWQLALWLTAAGSTPVRVDVNGHDVGTVTPGPAAARFVVSVPAGVLFRGDNRIGLDATAGSVRLHRYSVRPAGAPETD